jgi:5-methylcytosine-specific restriction protein A
MPTINLKERKRKRVKTKAIAYAEKVYHNRRWRTLRKQIILEEPLCRRCVNELDRVTPAQEVHHIIPFAQGRSPAQVERLAYDRDNCEPLCITCHKARHFEMNRL